MEGRRDYWARLGRYFRINRAGRRLSEPGSRQLGLARYHLAHHAHTQQENDPDLVLSAPFPTTRASYRRKFWRDITG